MNAQLGGAPLSGHFFEPVIAKIMKGHDGHIEGWVKTGVFNFDLNECLQPRFGIGHLGNLVAKMTAGADLLLGIQILHILGMTGRNQHVLITVEIHVQKNR